MEADGFQMSDPLIDENGDRRVLFGTALAGDRILYASIPTDSMQKACGETTYLGEGYSYILGKDGKIVVPPLRYNYEQVYEDIGNLLIYADNSSERVQAFIRALNSGATGSVVFQIDGQEQLFCFEPVYEKRGWQLVTVVALNAVEKDGAQIISTAVAMATVIIGVCSHGFGGRFVPVLVHAAQTAGKRPFSAGHLSGHIGKYGHGDLYTQRQKRCAGLCV